MTGDPQPVEVKNEDPLPVTVHETADTPAVTDAKVAAAGARVEAAILRTSDQRRISGIWERTQQVIALLVVGASVTAAEFLIVFNAVRGSDPNQVAFVFLASVANLVIGFYFGRTNHQKMGGDPGDTRGTP